MSSRTSLIILFNQLSLIKMIRNYTHMINRARERERERERKRERDKERGRKSESEVSIYKEGRESIRE